MNERIAAEMDLLRKKFPDLEHTEEGQWVHIPSYPLPEGWNRSATDVAFQMPQSYPGTPPYGIYVPVGILFNESRPESYTEPAPAQPPFAGTWGIFSWTTVDGQWRATTDPLTGANLINWVIGFTQRFKEGR